MKLGTLETDQIHRGNLFWLIAAQTASIIPLLFYLPKWVLLLWAIAIFWRLQIHRSALPFPSMFIKLFMAMGAVVGIAVNYSGQIGAEPMIAFLVCSFVMKIIEMRSRKDALIVLFIGFIAIATQFLFAQDLLAGIYGTFSLFVLLSAWSAIFHHDKLALRQYFFIGGKLVAHSAPMMLVLFVVMPRLGPLWAVPIPGGQGKVGFSDSVELGDVGNLVRSAEVAFRVSFNSTVPQLGDLYWRALILDEFDGLRWTLHDANSSLVPMANLPEKKQAIGEFYDYSVILEPHQYRWLFTLGYARAAESAQLTVQQNSQFLMLSKKPVMQKAEYRVLASRDIAWPNLTASEWRQNIQLPQNVNPQARHLVSQWLDEKLSVNAIMDKALSMYAKEFVYTLQTNPVKLNAIDYFLFQGKRGFCEHFASSFVFMMRAAGIPARVVVGYQGGDFNNREDYFIVRQSDAHAWAEVWLTGQGWVRVDPTAAVAPNRIDMGVSEALTQEDRKLLGGSWQFSAARFLAKRWDALNYSWNRWVLNYDGNKQTGLLTKILGSADPLRVGLVLVLMCLLLILPIAFLHWWRSRKKFEFAENKAMDRLFQKLAREGYQRAPGESVMSYLDRVALLIGPNGTILCALARAYEAHSYGGRAQLQKIQKLSRLAVSSKIWAKNQQNMTAARS